MDGLHTVELDVGIMALHQASASSEHARMLSTRPRRKRRIDALSYVDTRRPWTLPRTAVRTITSIISRQQSEFMLKQV